MHPGISPVYQPASQPGTSPPKFVTRALPVIALPEGEKERVAGGRIRKKELEREENKLTMKEEYEKNDILH